MEAILGGCRWLVAASARSIASVAEDGIDLAQFRALVIVASRTSVSLGQLATSAGLNLSTASRMCDRLVGMTLLDRADDPTDRRQLVLTLTAKGRQVIARVARRRKAALEPALRTLSPTRRRHLIRALHYLAAAAEQPDERDLWAVGWTT